MATKKINYKDKAPLQTKPEIPEENKVNAEDLNQIKEVVNNNADEIELRQLKEEGKGLSKNDFTDELKAKLESLNNYNDTEIKKEISEINKKVAENTENDIKQDNEILELKTNYTNLQEQNTKLESQIKKDRENMINLEVEGQSIHIEDSSNLEGQLEVLGNVEQDTREGYNLLENILTDRTVNGITVKINKDKSITLNGTATNDVYLDINKENTMMLEANEEYTMSIGIKLPSNLRMKTRLINEVKDIISIEIGESKKTYTGTEKQEVYTYIQIMKGTSVNNITVYPMIYKGTEEKPYEQYGASPSPEYPSEIRAVGDKGSVGIKKQNKNLFDILKYPFTNKVAYAPNGQLNYWTGYYGITEYFPVEENSNYVFSNDLNKPITYGLMFYNKNKEFISGIVENTTKFITPKNCKYIRFSIQSDTIPNKVQIEHGDKATEIVEHQEQTKILPIQKPMLEGDYFIKEADGWKEVHTWENKVINGTETMVDGNSPVADNTLVVSIPRKDSGLTNDKINIISEQFKGNTTANLWITDKEGISLSVGYISVRINRKRANTLEEVKEYLKQNNIKCFLKKSTENKLLCTPEQTKVLEELDNFQTYKPVTNITTDSIAKLKLKYIADTKTYVDNKVGNLEQQVNVINQLLSTTKTSSVLLDNLQTDIESEVI